MNDKNWNELNDILKKLEKNRSELEIIIERITNLLKITSDDI